jgi:hypothetical protein
MVATRKYKEIYDMQASRRKATWFNMQKLVVNYYALGILVLRSRHLLKCHTPVLKAQNRSLHTCAQDV